MRKSKKFTDGFYRSVIHDRMMTYFKANQNKYLTLDDHVEHFCQEEPTLIRDIRFTNWLAFSIGLKGELTFAIRQAQDKLNLIISSAVKGQGYTCLNPNDMRSIGQWKSKFDARSTRKEIPKQEKMNDDQLFLETVKRCTEPQIRKRLRALAIKYQVRTQP